MNTLLNFLTRSTRHTVIASICLGLLFAGVHNAPFANFAYAANIPLVTGVQDVGALNPTLNQIITSIRTGVSGLLNAQYVTSGSGADTTEDTLYTYTIPANTLTIPGQTLHIHCWGTTGATANNKTMKLYHGASVISTPTAATNAKGWDLWLHVTRGNTGALQQVMGTGYVDTTLVTPYNNAGTDSYASALVVKCTGTNGTAVASDVAGQGMTVELSQ